MSRGITPDHFMVKRDHLRIWGEFLTINGLINKLLGKIHQSEFKNFGLWLLNKTKHTSKHLLRKKY